MRSRHTLGWCNICGFTVLCGRCGYNYCSGGSGPDCPDCPIDQIDIGTTSFAQVTATHQEIEDYLTYRLSLISEMVGSEDPAWAGAEAAKYRLECAEQHALLDNALTLSGRVV